MLLRQRLDFVHVDAMILAAHIVGNHAIPFAGKIDRRAVSQMAPGCEIEAHEDVARLQQGEIDGLVCLGAGMGLHIGKAAVEEPTGALDRKALGDVDIFAAAVIAPAGIAFGIFVGQDRSLRVQNSARNDVLRGNQLDLFLLALELRSHGGSQFRVGFA